MGRVKNSNKVMLNKTNRHNFKLASFIQLKKYRDSLTANLADNKQVFKTINTFNNRPEKCLNFKTPCKIFKESIDIHVKKFIELCS